MCEIILSKHPYYCDLVASQPRSSKLRPLIYTPVHWDDFTVSRDTVTHRGDMWLMEENGSLQRRKCFPFSAHTDGQLNEQEGHHGFTSAFLIGLFLLGGLTDWLNSLFGTCIIQTLRPQTKAISSLLVLFSLHKHISQHYHTEYFHLNAAVLSTSSWRVIKDAPLKNQLLQITILKNQETEQCANESGGPHHKCRSRIKHSGNAMIHSWCKIPAEHPAELFHLERNNIQKTKLWS